MATIVQTRTTSNVQTRLDKQSENASDDISQKWFTQLLKTVEQSHFQAYAHAWAFNSSITNSTCRLWYFILHRILRPNPQLYMAIRTCNFDARNGG
ncbi:unnamed protein product [Rotaria socialis]|uniref:Uncharacterized protein n=1 Tax=Rotaria socialis TaxID=392032 RepID=A0A818CIX2_9BILA|nr:unnamed protein product [Rotaria socialis]CAF3493643.1 unnamed protein product [Rotaria socialis]CAF3667604.1 unnamed protein product [Rotaria socialis]CAF4532691.1 unnamed protein product [Rotaria socialis]CAF4551768.1 unnamed protein product [Rotaria socialis]